MLDLLNETSKLGCKPVGTPIEQNHKLGEAYEDLVMDKGTYQPIPMQTMQGPWLLTRGQHLTIVPFLAEIC